MILTCVCEEHNNFMKIKKPLNLTSRGLVLLFGIISVSGCGIKGDPLPPFEQQTVQASPNSETPVPKKSVKKIK